MPVNPHRYMVERDVGEPEVDALVALIRAGETRHYRGWLPIGDSRWFATTGSRGRTTLGTSSMAPPWNRESIGLSSVRATSRADCDGRFSASRKGVVMHAKVFEVRDWEVQTRVGEALEKQLNDFLTAQKEVSIEGFVMAPVMLPPTEARGLSSGADVNCVLYATLLYD